MCVGTISDIVPLIDENRVIAKLGLKLVQITKNLGLKALLESTKYKNIDSRCISFGIAPRVNACGRMGHQEEALNLFLAETEEESKEITERLNEYNTERQEKENAIFTEALKMIEEEGNDKSCIILAGENWHHGIIGIVSSKVSEVYYKPSILMCIEGELAKGSGRSIPGVDLHEILSNCSQYIDKFGGHAMAIGISVKKENLPKFKEEIEKYTENLKINEITPVIHIDEEVSIKSASNADIREVSLLEPFGEANKMPIYLFKNYKIISIRSVSDGKHLKLKVQDGNYFLDAIGFNMGDYADKFVVGDRVDIVGIFEINKINGEYETIQINVKDMRRAY